MLDVPARVSAWGDSPIAAMRSSVPHKLPERLQRQKWQIRVPEMQKMSLLHSIVQKLIR
jgi:hypothetical protein